MTPGMQFRLWLRTASRVQVGTTLAVMALVVTTVGTSLHVPHGASSASSAPAEGSTASANAPGVTGATGGPSVSPRVSSSASPGAGGVVESAPASSGGGDSSQSFGGGFGGSGSTGNSSGGAVDISRASDRGVNPKDCAKPCVKLGFLIAQIGGLDASGFALSLRGDIDKVIDAFVAYQNKHGGILGRQIVAVKRKTDPIDQGDQSTACTSMVKDNKVFGVIDTASLIFASTQACFTQDNKTPLVHSYAESDAFQAKAPGYDITETRSLDRIAREWPVEAHSLGFIKGGEKVGILEDNCEPSAGVVRTVLIPGIKAYKVASVKVYQSDCSAADAQAQPPALQNQMCIDGVTRVFMATSFVAAQTFLQSADSGPCGNKTNANHFQYIASDYSLLASDLFTRRFNKRQWDNSLGITNSYTGLKTQSAQLKFCSKILTDAGLPGLDTSYSNADANAICDYFSLFVGISKNVGGNLTRALWAQQAQRLGRFDGAFVPQSIFRPGKFSGGELVDDIQWHQDCTCYRSMAPLHVGAG